jgi:hypothetical protein
LAPSLPQLTDQEEEKLDLIINRFIDYDSGKRKGPGERDAIKDFQKLGPEAIPALIRGINRAARIEHSCPAVTIARKLNAMFRATTDADLLQYARENIGLGIERSQHLGVLKDLRVFCMTRRNMLLRTGLAFVPPQPDEAPGGSTGPIPLARKTPREMSLTDLVEAAGKERGLRLKTVLLELGKRDGDAAVGALGTAAASYEKDIQKLAREQLDKQLLKLGEDRLKEKLHDDRREVRAAAAHIAGRKGFHLEKDLSDLLRDEEQMVREAARDALSKLKG